MSIIRIPHRFLDDHSDRALATPEVVKATKQHYWIDTEDPAFPELLSDAKFYGDTWGPDEAPHIVRAAKALLKAIAKESSK